MQPSILYRWGTFAFRNRWKVVGGWIASLIIIAGIASVAGGELSDQFSNPGSDSQKGYDLLAERFPSQAGDTAQIVFQAEAGIADPAVQAEIR
ncbi:MAG: MMPL family transporter, partial [Chloroflexota bacterium]|nr:MMPL family transporter [Chloroflexota bacterium]